MIKLQNIDVVFNKGTNLENHVLKSLNLNISEGEFITVIGGNGAGKSTLLNVLSGEITPLRGKVEIDGEDCTKRSTEERAGSIARIFQDPMIGTFSHLSILENLALASQRGKRRGWGRAVKGSHLEYFKTRLSKLDMGLENRLGDQVSLLSGGQRQALSLVMASLEKSKILLLDEHTAALDPKTARVILDLTREIIEEQKLTAFMVTHSMHQALDFGTRTLVMKQGIIEKDLRAEERKTLGASDLLALFE